MTGSATMPDGVADNAAFGPTIWCFCSLKRIARRRSGMGVSRFLSRAGAAGSSLRKGTRRAQSTAPHRSSSHPASNSIAPMDVRRA